jgi:hypothetical protein
MLMFGLPAAPEERAAPAKSEDDLTDEGNTNSSLAGPSASPREPGWVFSEDTALFEFWAIPLYFPTSYALVKPYVKGFELNSLDAPLLRDVSIDNTWQPKSGISESN